MPIEVTACLSLRMCGLGPANLLQRFQSRDLSLGPYVRAAFLRMNVPACVLAQAH